MKREFSFRNLLRMAAAYCAAYMGAAFISGQETLQFYTAFGWWGIVGMVLVLSVLSYEGLCLHTAIYEHHLSDPYQALDILCGPRVGKIFTAVALVLLVANLISMSAGSGAVMVENYGLPNLLGRCIVMGGAVLVVWLGLDRIVEILGFVGPVTIALLLFVSIVSLVGALHPLPEDHHQRGDQERDRPHFRDGVHRHPGVGLDRRGRYALKSRPCLYSGEKRSML